MTDDRKQKASIVLKRIKELLEEIDCDMAFVCIELSDTEKITCGIATDEAEENISHEDLMLKTAGIIVSSISHLMNWSKEIGLPFGIALEHAKKCLREVAHEELGESDTGLDDLKKALKQEKHGKGDKS